MPHVIAWCGFLGAWLLVAGSLDQAVREIEDEEFEHDAIADADLLRRYDPAAPPPSPGPADGRRPR